VTILKLAALIVAIPFYYAWYGFVLAKLWLWFVVEHFQVPALTIPVAIGISLMASLLKGPQKTTKNDNHIQELATLFCFPLFALFIGWIVYHA